MSVRSHALDPETHRRILEMKDEGATLKQTMDELGLGETAVLKYRQIALPASGGGTLADSRLLKTNRALKQQLDQARQELTDSGIYREFMADILKGVRTEIPAWANKPVKAKGTGRTPSAEFCTPTMFLSDIHAGEWVDPAQIMHSNAYNPTVMLLRLEKFFRSGVKLAKERLKGYQYNGIVLALGGDNFSGDIHAELQRTNTATIQKEVCLLLEPMVAGIKLLADEFGRVMIPCTVGNHSRSTHKPVAKQRAESNFDWMLYTLLSIMLKEDKRISFVIPTGADQIYPVLGTNFLLTHGDQASGGGGVVGPIMPLARMDAAKRRRQDLLGQPYHIMLCGHFHRLKFFATGRDGIILNGALKGSPDEYTFVSNFEPEVPKQAFFLTHPERGVTIMSPIYCTHPQEKKFWGLTR